jgi:hypothetical protein
MGQSKRVQLSEIIHEKGKQLRKKRITIIVKKPRARNPFAIVAKFRKAGKHKEKRKEANKRACRPKYIEE